MTGSGPPAGTAVGRRPDLLSAPAGVWPCTIADTMESREIAAGPALSGALRLLESAGLPASDLGHAHLEHFFFIGSASAPTGLVGLEPYGDCALLRSLVVAPSARADGAGTALVEHAESHARSLGVRDVYLLTTTAEGFFARLGYMRIGRESAPGAVRATREFSEICPAGSAFMVKHLLT